MSSEILIALGRVVYINYGQHTEKIAVVVDIVNGKKVVVDGPTTDVPRQVISNTRLSLTRFLVPEVTRNMKQAELM